MPLIFFRAHLHVCFSKSLGSCWSTPGHTGVLHYIAGRSNWKPLMRPFHRCVVWHWAHSTLEASFTKASTCKMLCVLVHICLSYLFPVLCFLGNKRKDCIIETLKSNSVSVFWLHWYWKDPHKVALGNVPDSLWTLSVKQFCIIVNSFYPSRRELCRFSSISCWLGFWRAFL